MSEQQFQRFRVEGVTVEEVNGQLVLAGLDGTAQRAIRNFLARPVELILEPLDMREIVYPEMDTAYKTSSQIR